MAELYRVDSPINREQRNNLNETFKDVQSQIGSTFLNINKVKDEVIGFQQQIDVLVVDGDSSPEAAQARVSYDGNVFNTLKERLDAEQRDFNIKLEGRSVSVTEFGALGDGSTDDTQAFIDAKGYCISNDLVLFVPPNLDCYISQDLDLFGLKYINSEGKITLADDKILTFGISSSLVLSSNYNFIDVSGKLRSMGIKNSLVNVSRATTFEIYAEGNDTTKRSVAYNRFTLGNITNLRIDSVDGGWINENAFFGGRVFNVFIGGSYSHNNNIFYKVCLENATLEIERGSCNTFYDVRLEGNNSINFGVNSYDNFLVKSWSSGAGAYLRGTSIPSYTDLGKNNNVTHILDSYYDFVNALSYHKNSNNYDTDVIVKSENGLTVKALTNLSVSDLIPVDKNFGFRLNSDAATWRVRMYCYNSNKELITSEPTGSFNSGQMTWQSSINCFSTTSNLSSLGGAVFSGTDVKYVNFEVRPNVQLDFNRMDFSFLILKGSNNKSYFNENKLRGSSIPTSGYWYRGDYISNETPSELGTSPNKYIVNGWTCITAGSPGVWVQNRSLTGN